MKSGILEDVHYYDNRFETQNGLVELDRVYVIDENQFCEDDYALLGDIYRNLPGYLADTQYPYWFGQNESDIYLWASMEPPGIQFCGRVNVGDFKAWETRFHDLLVKADFPFKQI